MKRALGVALLAAFFIATHTKPIAFAEQSRSGRSYSSLNAELRRIMSEADLGHATLGIVFVDIETGQVIYERNADELFNPASNAKIVTAAAALSILGPEYRFETALYGRTDGAAVDGPLYLRGRGDPTLRTEDLWGLAADLRRRGIRVIRGDIVVDSTFFDDQTEPPAFDQQPDERNYFRAPVGGININRNVVTVHIRPSSSPGRAANVMAEPSGYLDLDNDAVTSESGSHSIRFSTRSSSDGTRARVWGSIPVDHRVIRQRARIDNPSLFAGAALAEALSSVGIRVRGRVRQGQMAQPARMLAYHRSEPLSSLLWMVGKNSDNFTAETLMKTLGAQGSAPGTWERGQAAVRRYLENLGIDPTTFQFMNGSGLFDANRFTPRQMATVLSSVWQNQTIRPEFLSQLAIGGVDGTLSGRFRRSPSLRNVRAKTGTLASVTALSGYVVAPSGGHTIAFSILINGARGKIAHGRQLQERMVTAVAEHLHEGS